MPLVGLMPSVPFHDASYTAGALSKQKDTYLCYIPLRMRMRVKILAGSTRP